MGENFRGTLAVSECVHVRVWDAASPGDIRGWISMR